MIEVRDLSHAFLKKSLFQDVNLRLVRDERYGVVGANGSGKSTFLKILSHEFEPDSVEIDYQAGTEYFRIGQDHNLNDELPIIDTAMMGQEKVFNALKRKEELVQSGAHGELSAEIFALEEIIQNGEGYRLRSRAEAILEGLGIKTTDHDKPLKILSGGYKWRVFLAQALVKKPDVLMLDEPTNHLDIVSIRWLELFLSTYQGLVILVSHDKRFMDHVCTQILDIDFDTIMTYAGNYTAYEEARRLFLLQKEKEILAQEKDIARKQAFIDRFRYKATKARQAQSRIKQIEKMEIVLPVRTSRLHPKLRFDTDEMGSKEVLTVKHLTKGYDDKKIITDLSFSVQRKEKIAIVGPNGAGKSTLIKALALEFAECQKYIKWGHGVTLGYFAQDVATKIKNADISVLDWFWQFCADRPQSYVQGMLGRVLFTGDDVKKSTKDLSGGELSRLYLAYLMFLKPNVLLLDEPTNHLDLESIESLTQALRDFEGTVILVSHDRSFIDQIAERIVEIELSGITDFLGSYSEFVASQNRDYLDVVKKNLPGKDNAKSSTAKENYEEQKRRRALVQKLRRDLERVMLAVEETESNIARIDHQFADEKFFTNVDFSEVADLEREKNSLNEKLDGLLKEWEQTEQMLSTITLPEDATR